MPNRGLSRKLFSTWQDKRELRQSQKRAISKNKMHYMGISQKYLGGIYFTLKVSQKANKAI